MIWAGKPPRVDKDLPAALDDEYWIEAEIVWSGDEQPWDGGFIDWDGEGSDPDQTHIYTDNWVDDDGTVDPLPQFTIIYLPIIR